MLQKTVPILKENFLYVREYVLSTSGEQILQSHLQQAPLPWVPGPNVRGSASWEPPTSKTWSFCITSAFASIWDQKLMHLKWSSASMEETQCLHGYVCVCVHTCVCMVKARGSVHLPGGWSAVQGEWGELAGPGLALLRGPQGKPPKVWTGHLRTEIFSRKFPSLILTILGVELGLFLPSLNHSINQP